jgi:hypothetical protein
MAARARGQISAAELTAALSDVTTAPASAGGILQPMWVGNLWADDPQPRVHVDAITGPRPLTSLTISGFVWNPGMTVAQWAGDKTAIPTSVPKAVIGSATAKRWAGGVDVAREFVDLGSPEIIADLLATARDDYRTKTATFYEQGPITVEALNVAQGGIDEAVHGYTGTLINKPAYVVKATATIARAGGASSSSSKSKS